MNLIGDVRGRSTLIWTTSLITAERW